MMHKKSWMVATVLVASLGVAGCGGHDAAPGAQGPAAPPVKLGKPNSADVRSVTLSAAAQQRLGIATAKIGVYTPAAKGAKPELVMPYAALVYDKQGATWTYVTQQKLTYVRQPVVVEHIDAESAYLTAGPAKGTTIVTTGVEELLGAEYEISGEE